MFEEQIAKILDNLEAAHSAYYAADVFGGPSLHFHLRSIETARSEDPERFSEYVYATLASWGMHRMGRGGSKMRNYEDFAESIRVLWPKIRLLQDTQHSSMTEEDWASLKDIFRGIRVMATGTSLVGNSKVMAHALQGMVPPVDREYTLRFLYGNTNIRNDIEHEWCRLRTILEDFFYPVAQSPTYQSFLSRWQTEKHHFKWDTSSLKTIDNLVIGSVKLAKQGVAANG